MNVSQQMTACKRVPTLKEATTVHVNPSFLKQTPPTGENVQVSTVQIPSRSMLFKNSLVNRFNFKV